MPATSLLLLLVTALLALEIVVYPGVIQNNLGIPALVLALIPAVLRIFFGPSLTRVLPRALQENMMWLATLLFGVLFAATLADYLIYPNYTFSTFSIHPTGMLPLAALLAIASYALVSSKIVQRQFSWRIFVLPFWLFAFIFPHRWMFPETWTYIIKEDSVVEYLTMMAYALASLLSFFTAAFLMRRRSTWKKNTLLYGTVVAALLLLGLGCFLIAGEEISWGQRLLGIETPEHLAERNTQGELNLHNNKAVFGYIYQAYNVVALLGMTAWAIRWALMKLVPKSFLARFAEITLPSWELVLFFVPTYIFTLLRTEPVQAEVIAWEETSELFLALGFMMSVLWIWRRLKKRLPGR